jgi:hypothetical protein
MGLQTPDEASPELIAYVEKVNTEWLVGYPAMVEAYYVNDEFNEGWYLRLKNVEHNVTITELLPPTMEGFLIRKYFFVYQDARQAGREEGRVTGAADIVEGILKASSLRSKQLAQQVVNEIADRIK